MVKPFSIDPARVQAFAEAYAPIVLEAVKKLPGWRGDVSSEEYAVSMTYAMVEAIERGGVDAIAHYYLNTKGGALKLTADALGIRVEHLDIYLSGGNT